MSQRALRKAPRVVTEFVFDVVRRDGRVDLMQWSCVPHVHPEALDEEPGVRGLGHGYMRCSTNGANACTRERRTK